jgi:membrane protein required for colicin V production
MNWADYTVLGVIALSVLIGLWRGLVSEVMALAVWIAAFWVAWWLGPSVAERFEGIIDLPSARVLAGYGLCFLVVLLLGALLRFVVSKLVESTGLTGTDRLLGMGFGFARGVLLVTLAVFLLGFTPFTRDPWWQQSVLLGQAQKVADWMVEKLPDNVRRYVHPHKTPDLPVPGGLPQAVTARFSGADTSTWPAGSASMAPRAQAVGTTANH